MSEYSSFGILESNEACEEGLSGGEARQAILDRVKSALQQDSEATITAVVYKRGRNELKELRGSKGAEKADAFLYALSDRDLVSSKWVFPTFVLTVSAEKEEPGEA